MKKFMALVILCAAVTGFAAAGDLVFHGGAGYHSSYFSSKLAVPKNIRSLPLGIGAYIGVGYAFGEKEKFAMGAEFSPSWDLAVKPFALSNFCYQARAFAQLKASEDVTITAFGGYAGNQFFGANWPAWRDSASWAAGARVRAFFIYAEYVAIFNNQVTGITKNEVALGVSVFK